jgi:hypothetical protein
MRGPGGVPSAAGRTARDLRSGYEDSYDICGLNGNAAFLMIFRSSHRGGRQLSISAPEVAHLLAAVAALMVAAHTLGGLFARFRQPRVIGEIAGLVLGPTRSGSWRRTQERGLVPAAT